MNTNVKTKTLVAVAALCALAYVVMLVGRVPIVPTLSFLKYDPKDVIIVIGGFVFGPFYAFLISLVVSLIEMITVSETGFIGLIMNVLASCSFACVASFAYKKNRTIKSAVIGLVLGVFIMTAVMLLWNYLITPLYMGYPREAVVKLLLPAFLPFNLLKGGLNAGLSILIYKPFSSALKAAGLMPKRESEKTSSSVSGGVSADNAEDKSENQSDKSYVTPQKKPFKLNIGVMLFALIVLATCVLVVLALNKVI